jgi:hypothetical protein
MIKAKTIIPGFSVTFDVTPVTTPKDLLPHALAAVVTALIKHAVCDEVVLTRHVIQVRARIPDDTEPLVIERIARKLRGIANDAVVEALKTTPARQSILTGPNEQGRYSVTYTCSCESPPAVGQDHEAECFAEIASFAVFKRAKEQAAGWTPAQKDLELRACEKQWQGPVEQSKIDPDEIRRTDVMTRAGFEKAATRSSDRTSEDDLGFRTRCGLVIHESRHLSDSQKCAYYENLRVLTGFHLDQFARDKCGLYRNRRVG